MCEVVSYNDLAFSGHYNQQLGIEDRDRLTLLTLLTLFLWQNYVYGEHMLHLKLLHHWNET
jgi:hypothetical protein